MKPRAFKYAMLLASLPVHPTSLFSAGLTPISRIQLDQRLTLLDEGDTQDLQRIEDLLRWSQIHNADDAFIIGKSHDVIATVGDRFLREQILWRLEYRTFLAALRMRHAGFAPTAARPFHGVGQWLDAIRKNWDKTDFGLGHRLPWLIQAQRLLAENRVHELEKLLLSQAWRHYAETSGRHVFDFPAVVIYVLRWDIINRWTRYQSDAAVARFDALTEAILAGAKNVF